MRYLLVFAMLGATSCKPHHEKSECPPPPEPVVCPSPTPGSRPATLQVVPECKVGKDGKLHAFGAMTVAVTVGPAGGRTENQRHLFRLECDLAKGRCVGLAVLLHRVESGFLQADNISDLPDLIITSRTNQSVTVMDQSHTMTWVVDTFGRKLHFSADTRETPETSEMHLRGDLDCPP